MNENTTPAVEASTALSTKACAALNAFARAGLAFIGLWFLAQGAYDRWRPEPPAAQSTDYCGPPAYYGTNRGTGAGPGHGGYGSDVTGAGGVNGSR
ncbi:hypothetical protein JCM19000A_00700 [Silvimonas sp. JCM 19000]